MSSLGLQLIQMTPVENVMFIQVENQHAETSSTEAPLDQWQLYFSKLFNNLFRRVGNFLKLQSTSRIFRKLLPVQQKGRRVPITLQG